jgi:hypothetical protein
VAYTNGGEQVRRRSVRKCVPSKGKSTTCVVPGPTLTLLRSQFAQTPNGFPQPMRFFPEDHLRETVKRTEIVELFGPAPSRRAKKISASLFCSLLSGKQIGSGFAHDCVRHHAVRRLQRFPEGARKARIGRDSRGGQRASNRKPSVRCRKSGGPKPRGMHLSHSTPSSTRRSHDPAYNSRLRAIATAALTASLRSTA